MTDSAVIETTGLTREYDSVKAVDGLDMSISEGEIFGFLGPNGAGKTTTLLMLLGLSRPSGGNARVCGLDPTKEAKKVKALVGYLPENVGFYGDLTAEESLRYVADLNGIDQKTAERRIEEALETVG
ncbi:MAG: ATP-binding cassette domain-containing protein, partial [Desulfobacteraceae bacterium]